MYTVEFVETKQVTVARVFLSLLASCINVSWDEDDEWDQSGMKTPLKKKLMNTSETFA